MRATTLLTPLLYLPLYSPLSLRLKVVEKTTNVKVFWPHFWERLQLSRIIYDILLARFTLFAKFGGVPFGDLRPRSLAVK